MGEVALRKIQVGVEVTRGTAVAATRRLYGTLVPTRSQPHRFAVEDRGELIDKFRANLKQVEASCTIVADATFEDLPFYATLFLGTSVDTANDPSTPEWYTHVINSDRTSDNLKTITIEAGDETVAWQGPFGTVDSADITLALDDALSISMATFTNDWIPETSADLATTYDGFTPNIAEHVVESVMGYQSSLYLDPAGATPGTTHVTGRFIAATMGYHNQNKRKYFGDGTATFTKLGRGRRQVHCQVTFEAEDFKQYSIYAKNQSVVARIALTGTLLDPEDPSTSQAKTMYFDFWGTFDTFTQATRDTNTTFQFDLQAVKDATTGTDARITVVNALATP